MEVTVSKVDSPAECARFLPLRREFHQSQPVNVVFGLPGDEPPQSTYGPEDFLIVAEDSEGNVIGYAANRVETSDEPNPSPDERREVDEFFDFTWKKAQLDELPQRLIILTSLAVTEGWRGRGVARKLVEKSMATARAAGFRTLAMCCVSEFSARIACSLGWKERYRLAYSDYPRLSGRSVQLNPNPPHDHVYFYYTDLTA